MAQTKLSFFFNKESRVMRGMEILGIVLLALLLFTWWPGGKSLGQQIAFFLFIFVYGVFRAFAMINWYKSENPYEGIQLHFKKMIVLVAYVMPTFSFLLLIGFPGWILYFADFLLILMVHINFILLYFHLRDKETLPINYFTHNKHLKS